MSDLDHLLSECSEEVEADFAQYYPGVDLAELHQPWHPGRLTWRRFGVLLRGLSMESAYRTWVRDNVPVTPSDESTDIDFTGQRWGLGNFQLAQLTNTFAAAFAGEDFQPSPVPQPKQSVPVDAEPESTLTREQQLDMLAQLRRNRRWGE